MAKHRRREPQFVPLEASGRAGTAPSRLGDDGPGQADARFIQGTDERADRTDAREPARRQDHLIAPLRSA